ncbi:Peptidase, A24 (Type IV prepilin peptidase) family protein, partial [human gut metagenome]
MKGTNYVIGLFVYIASILLPIIVSSKAISYTHIALYAVFSLIIIAGATIDM